MRDRLRERDREIYTKAKPSHDSLITVPLDPPLLQGAVPKGNATRENIQRMGLREGQVIFKCPKCCSIKPERAHHCSVCQRCIRKMDHHCPWVNNCVGENNQKFFVLFTVSSVEEHLFTVSSVAEHRDDDRK